MNKHLIQMLRPKQWLKNLILFFPPFLSGNIMQPLILQNGLLPFCSFCLVSSAGYYLNDLFDRQRDILHPQKCLRALPAGLVEPRSVIIWALIIMASGLMLASVFSVSVLLLVSIYLIISILYSVLFKHIVLIDLLCISAGFLIRLQAGSEIFQVPISPWLFLTVFLLSIFLSAGKRLGESLSLGDFAGKHRASLSDYSSVFLNGLIFMTGSAVLVTYAMYSMSKAKLILTVPLCLLGLLRYIFIVTSEKNGDPTELLLKDKSIMLVSLLWLLMVSWSIYF